MFIFTPSRSLVLIFTTLSIFSCIPKSHGKHEIQDNDNASRWINRLQISYLSIQKYNVEEISFSIIPNEQKSNYMSRLEHSQYIELEEYEYSKLTGKKLEKKHGLAIRAVYAHLGGGFDVIRNNMNGNNVFFVHYMVMGSSISEINKEILIIEVDELPNEIFIDYTVVK